MILLFNSLEFRMLKFGWIVPIIIFQSPNKSVDIVKKKKVKQELFAVKFKPPQNPQNPELNF